jgi:RNA polymerase sigma factor (sigma-70 family)
MATQQTHIGQLTNIVSALSLISPHYIEERFYFAPIDILWHHKPMESLFIETISDRSKEKEIRSSLKAFAYTLCQNPDDAEDLVQQTYEKSLKNHESFVGGSVKSWMFTICKNAFRDNYKKGTSWEPFSDRDFDGQKDEKWGTRVKIVQSIGSRDDLPPLPVEGDQLSSIEEDEAADRMKFCIQQLNQQEQTVINYRRFEMSISEIAESIELSRVNVSQISRRARIKLCECMGVNV